jgi:hypothetical protein
MHANWNQRIATLLNESMSAARAVQAAQRQQHAVQTA